MTNNGYKVFSIYDLNNILCINADLCQTLGIENNNDNIKQSIEAARYKSDKINSLSKN
jgi:hypothetical protein